METWISLETIRKSRKTTQAWKQTNKELKNSKKDNKKVRRENASTNTGTGTGTGTNTGGVGPRVDNSSRPPVDVDCGCGLQAC